MFKLDDNLLRELGLGTLPTEEKNRMLSHIYETLEMRVGMKLAEQMSNEQLDEFEGFIDRNDEAGALKWLETNFPNYKQVVATELESLKNEVKAAAPQIVAASQAAQAAQSQMPQPGMMPMGAAPAQTMQSAMPAQAPMGVQQDVYTPGTQAAQPAVDPYTEQLRRAMPDQAAAAAQAANPYAQPYAPQPSGPSYADPQQYSAPAQPFQPVTQPQHQPMAQQPMPQQPAQPYPAQMQPTDQPLPQAAPDPYYAAPAQHPMPPAADHAYKPQYPQPVMPPMSDPSAPVPPAQ